MIRSLLALSLFSLFSAAHAEITESNVTVQLKVYQQNDPSPENKAGFATLSYSVRTINTSVLIEAINSSITGQFTKKAKLILRSEISQGGTEVKFVLREAGKTDVTVENPMELHFINSQSATVIKGKINEGEKIGNAILLGMASADLGPTESEMLEFNGMATQNMRIIKSKQFPTKEINLSTSSFTGHSSNSTGDNPANGFIQGTIKVTAPKVMQSPTPGQ